MRIDQEPPPDAPTPDALEASGLPLYRSLGRSLLRRIRSGEWQPGQQIPSERELMALTGLSRDTVRKGLDDLVRQGVLDRVQGRGTFVAARGPGPRLADLAGIWRGAGRQVELLLTDCGSGDVPEDVRQVLALSALERIIWIQHLLTLDGTPAAVQHAYLPQALFPTLLKQCAAGQDLAAAVSSTEGAGIVFYAESLEPTALGSLEAYLLGLRAGLPALLLEHLGLDARGRRVLFQSSTLRGDLCRAYVADALGAWNLREAEAAPPHFAAALRDAEHALRERHAPQPVRAAAGVAARPAAARPWPTPALPERANAPRRSVYSVAPAPAVPADQAALSRRQFLRMTSLVAASSLAAVCPPVAAASAPAGKAPAQAPAAAAPGEPATTLERRPLVFREAPLLAERVAAGLLPPVEQRLPRIPSLYPVAETIGRYGGTIRRAVAGRSDFGGASKWVATSLTHFNPDLSLRPDLCEAWEVNDEATTYTVHLRDGLCWSDGQPFTSEDVRWWYEEVIRDKDLSQGAARGYTTGEPPVLMSLEVPDDLTVVIRFAHPFPVFMHQQNSAEPFLPSHYMRQFHARFAEDPDALQRRAEEAGLPSWTAYFWERDKWYMNPARPVLYPWMATNRLDSDLFVLERNPFFCGIDAAGQQLPYVDRVTFRQFDSLDVFNMWVLNGEIDLQGRHVDIGAYDLFREGQARGGYRVDLWQADDGDTLGPNHDCQDARLRAFFGQREVRKALSLAIDREEINKQVYNGMGTPRQASPTSQGPYYHEPAARATRHTPRRRPTASSTRPGMPPETPPAGACGTMARVSRSRSSWRAGLARARRARARQRW